MGVMTVKGVVSRDALGVTTPHEHALIDIRNQFPGSASTDPFGWYTPVSKEHYARLMSDPYALRDNLVMDDRELAIAEASLFAKAGGQTFVDVTLPEIGRDPAFLLRLSEETGMHVVAACGAYTADAHPQSIAFLSEQALAELFITELTQGIDGTGIRAGIIGEIGTSKELLAQEQKVLRAAAIAHVRTGAPVMVHLCPWAKHGAQVIRILKDGGVDPARICLCHTDVLLDLTDMEALLKQGVYLEFDNFGKAFTSGSAYGRFPSDNERMEVLYRLIDRGYLKQLLVSCDVCLKNLLTVHDGPGYAHVITKMTQKLKAERSDWETVLQALLMDNPARYLDNPRLQPERSNVREMV